MLKTPQGFLHWKFQVLDDTSRSPFFVDSVGFWVLKKCKEKSSKHDSSENNKNKLKSSLTIFQCLMWVVCELLIGLYIRIKFLEISKIYPPGLQKPASIEVYPKSLLSNMFQKKMINIPSKIFARKGFYLQRMSSKKKSYVRNLWKMISLLCTPFASLQNACPLG